jgi:hypothetical protein
LTEFCFHAQVVRVIETRAQNSSESRFFFLTVQL